MSLEGGLNFLSLKNSKWIKEINNYYNFNTNREIICKLNKNLYLVCGNNKFFIVDILKHEINSVINLEYKNINIITIKKGFKSNDILVLMDNNWRNSKNLEDNTYEYLEGYKFNKFKLEKFYEYKESDKNISLFEKFENNKIAFAMDIYKLFSSETRTKCINIMNI